MSEVVRMTEAEARAKVAEIEQRYPGFVVIFDDPIDSCCRVDEVASIYSWGDATDAWEEYDGLRWLLGDH